MWIEEFGCFVFGFNKNKNNFMMKLICSKILIFEEGKLQFIGDKYVCIMVCCVIDIMIYGFVKDNLILILQIGVLLVYYYIYFV